MKYLDVRVTFLEVPDEISLCINITGCPNGCSKCHSPHLQQDIGEELDTARLKSLIEANTGITCVCFMGGDANPWWINRLAETVKVTYPEIKVAWYSGNSHISGALTLEYFDYVKTGSYVEQLGGLDNPNTNQRMYKIQNITNRFQKHED